MKENKERKVKRTTKRSEMIEKRATPVWKEKVKVCTKMFFRMFTFSHSFLNHFCHHHHNSISFSIIWCVCVYRTQYESLLCNVCLWVCVCASVCVYTYNSVCVACIPPHRSQLLLLMPFICFVDVPFAISQKWTHTQPANKAGTTERTLYPKRNAMVYNLLNENFKAYLSFKYKDGFTAQIYIL